jgi:diguanylate cyclase (GGDEF)-like protein
MNFDLLKTFTILYVEDELSLQEDIYQNISPFVKEVIRANDGEEGLKLYLKNKENIDLIISDILMPNMNGIEMIDAIRKIDLEIPVIYTTAFNDSQYMQKTIDQAVISYILKPIDIELLLKAIEKASLKIENENLKNELKIINKDLEAQVALKTKELQEQNRKLYEQLYSDSLTTLLNRKALLRDMQKIQNPVVVIIDIDSFKSINDLYGEHIGNLVLVSLTNVLKKFIKEIECEVYRIGPDTFTLLKDVEFNFEKCEDIISSLVKTISEHPINITEYAISIRINVTVGISDKNIDTLETADMALKKAKSDRLPFLMYKDEYNLDKAYQNDIKWTRIIKKAIEDNSITPYYQPIVDRDKKIIKYESLIRIVEDDNIYSPFLFLDISKKVKLYSQLEKTIVTKALDKAKQYNTNISINVSIEDIVNSEFIQFLEKELTKNSIAHLITFELLESESITDYEKVIHFIDKVKDLGCKIAIDDFGSGYSNFAYLLKLKPDYIKIDGSSVKNIHTDKNSYLITKTINDFAHNLGIKTIAEFVHCEEVFNILKELGVDEYQGFYFCEPVEHFH